MRLLSIVALCVIALPAFAQTPFNDPSRNIFDTYDQLCDGTDPSITFCDGFEDGTYIVTAGPPSSENDYWQRGVFHTPFPDQFGRDFAECNSGTINPNRADFGAAGTRCTATMDWVTNRDKGQDAVHAITAQPGNPAQLRAVGTRNYYVRFYFKESGVTSTRCPGGWPNCQAFNQFGPNGYKGVELSHGMITGGIYGPVFGTLFANSSVYAVGINTCYPSASSGGQMNQNRGNNFNHMSHRDEWIFAEFHVVEHPTNGIIEYWMDNCGRDGNQCSGTPTLRGRYTNENTQNVCQPGNSGQNMRTMWVNFWNTRVTGEIQFDEIVTRDGEVMNAPIGFAQIGPGGIVQPPPPPPAGTPPLPPVLLPPQ